MDLDDVKVQTASEQSKEHDGTLKIGCGWLEIGLQFASSARKFELRLGLLEQFFCSLAIGMCCIYILDGFEMVFGKK